MQPKAPLLQILRVAGAQEDVFTLKEVSCLGKCQECSLLYPLFTMSLHRNGSSSGNFAYSVISYCSVAWWYLISILWCRWCTTWDSTSWGSNCMTSRGSTSFTARMTLWGSCWRWRAFRSKTPGIQPSAELNVQSTFKVRDCILNVCILVSQPGVRNAQEILSCARLFW